MLKQVRLRTLFEHQVIRLLQHKGAVIGCQGAGPHGDFEVQAEHVVLCSGGINGNLELVRQHWDPVYGPYPENLLNGTDPRADGALHKQV